MLKRITAHLAKLLWGGGDDERRNAIEMQDAAHMLEMDEAMAGAGAQLSGVYHRSETQEALKRASSHDQE